MTATVGGMPVAVVRGRDLELRAFYDVCKHRPPAAARVGTTRSIVCPYHAWVYGLDGELCGARRTETMVSFDKSEICLDPVQVKQFGGLVFINLDPTAAPLAEQAPDIAAEMEQWAPDVATLTPARMTTSPTTSPRRR